MPDPIKRLNYFDHQFMHVEDFTDEQTYHREMRRLHNQLLHTWGICAGLQLSYPAGATVATVSTAKVASASPSWRVPMTSSAARNR